jgi:CheY-like chemotaxis protein
MSLPRVLAVDDDEIIQRFVQMALDTEALELRQAGSVDEAVALLRSEGPVDLILTDLMLPGASGVDLVRTLRATPALLGSARIVVLSAGLNSATSQRLEAQGVWRQLHKPLAVSELQTAVRAALGMEQSVVLEPDKPRRVTPDTTPEQRAIDLHFGGDAALFHAFRTSCAAQFALDVTQGNTLARAGDLPGLRRHAHSLASVFATLGEEAAATQARALQHACAQGQSSAIALWPALARVLEHLSQQK